VDDGDLVSVLPPPPPPSDLPPPPDGLAASLGPVATGPPKATWKWWEILLVGFAALIIGLIPAAAVYIGAGQTPSSTGLQNGVDFLANGVDQVVLLGVVLGYLQWRHRGWQRAVRLPRLRELPKELAIGAGIGIAMLYALGVLVSAVLQPIFHAVTHRDVTPADQIGPGIHGWDAVAFAVAAVVVAPVVEEFFFRGLLFRTLRDRHGLWVGAIASGILFALLHTGAGGEAQKLMLQIAIGLFGVGLALLYDWRGKLGANVAAHAVFNLITVLSVLKVFS
jgi:membrane protease YdiL (CAAX protease family)